MGSHENRKARSFARTVLAPSVATAAAYGGHGGYLTAELSIIHIAATLEASRDDFDLVSFLLASGVRDDRLALVADHVSELARLLRPEEPV